MIASTVAINLLVLAVPLYINRIYTSVLPQKAGDSLVVITGLLLLVLVLDVVLKIGRAWILSWAGAAEEHRLRKSAIRSLLSAPLSASTAASVGMRLAQMKSPVALRGLFEQQWLVRRVDVPFALIYLLVLALIGGWLVLIPLCLVPVFIMQARNTATHIAEAIRLRDQAETLRNDMTVACLQGAQTIKAMNLEGFLVRRLEPVEEALAKSVVNQEAAAAKMQNLSQLFSQWSQLLIVSFGGLLVINQELSTGALAACTLLSGQVTMPLSKLFTAEVQYASAGLAIEQFHKLSELPPEPHLLAGDHVPDQGDLSLGGLHLPQGGIVILSGGQSHQSSSFLSSLTGLDGEIPGDLLYGGHSVLGMERISLRQRLRLVRNGTPLLRGTVLEHLTQQRTDLLGEQATELCRRHGVASQILALPHGYETSVGENQDFPLSSGLAFRLQVMQALMNNPSILLIDASEVTLSISQLQWLLTLELEASRLVAVQSLPAISISKEWQQFSWQGNKLVEVLK